MEVLTYVSTSTWNGTVIVISTGVHCGQQGLILLILTSIHLFI